MKKPKLMVSSLFKQNTQPVGNEGGARITIREATRADFDQVYALFMQIIREGETLPYTPDEMSEERALNWLMKAPHTQCFVAEDDGGFAGCIALRPNRSGRASHVAHATYIVHPDHRGKGVGRALGEYSLAAARQQGYRDMQFNFVVSANTVAVKLWKSLGFVIVGTLPQAFNHATNGLVDVYVMHRPL